MRQIAFLLVLMCTSAAAYAGERLSVLQGATSASESHFTVLANRNQEVQFRARPSGQPGLLVPIQVTTMPYPGSEWVVHRLHATGLIPNVPYILEILDGKGRLLDQRKFQSLDTNKPNGRIAVGSCMI